MTLLTDALLAVALASISVGLALIACGLYMNRRR